MCGLHYLKCPSCTLLKVLALQDADYAAAGATIASTQAAFQQDIVLKVRPPIEGQESDQFREHAR